MAIGIEELATLLPADWPGQKLAVMPGDLSRYVTAGFGDAPLVVRPWDKLDVLDRQQSFYGLDRPESDPIRAAPSSDAKGGCVYFDDNIDGADLEALMRVMGIYGSMDDYVMFGAESPDTVRDRFLDQVRIVSRSALTHLFRVPADLVNPLSKPGAALGALIAAFVAAQRKKWNDPDYTYSGKLAGSLGGDGDWAKEALAFGILLENPYWQVLRIWSRPWLVTK